MVVARYMSRDYGSLPWNLDIGAPTYLIQSSTTVNSLTDWCTTGILPIQNLIVPTHADEILRERTGNSASSLKNLTINLTKNCISEGRS